MTRSERWILSEWLVARDRAARFSENLLFHRERTPFAEIDLVFESRSSAGRRLVLVEVKTWQGELWKTDVISRRQTERLKRARAYLEDRYSVETLLLLSVVDPLKALQGGDLTQGLQGSALRYFEDWF